MRTSLALITALVLFSGCSSFKEGTTYETRTIRDTVYVPVIDTSFSGVLDSTGTLTSVLVEGKDTIVVVKTEIKTDTVRTKIYVKQPPIEIVRVDTVKITNVEVGDSLKENFRDYAVGALIGFFALLLIIVFVRSR